MLCLQLRALFFAMLYSSLSLSLSLARPYILPNLTLTPLRVQTVMDCRPCNFYLCDRCSPMLQDLYESEDGRRRGTFAEVQLEFKVYS